MIVGDLTPGTMSWARMTAGAAVDCYRQAENSSGFAEMIEELARHGGWALLGCDSLDAFILEYIREPPDEVEHRFSDVAHRIRAARLLNVQPIQTVGRPTEDNGNGITITRGDDPEYIAARLKRDGRDDLIAAMASGDMSAAEARRRAGFAPNTTRIALHHDPHRAAAKIIERLGDEYVERLIVELDTQLRGGGQ